MTARRRGRISEFATDELHPESRGHPRSCADDHSEDASGDARWVFLSRELTAAAVIRRGDPTVDQFKTAPNNRAVRGVQGWPLELNTKGRDCAIARHHTGSRHYGVQESEIENASSERRGGDRGYRSVPCGLRQSTGHIHAGRAGGVWGRLQSLLRAVEQLHGQGRAAVRPPRLQRLLQR